MHHGLRDLVRPVLLLTLMILLPACNQEITQPAPPDSGPQEPPVPADLAAPSDLHVLDVGDNYVAMAWADTSGRHPATLIQTKSANGTGYSPLARLDPDQLEFEATIQPDSAYDFRAAFIASSDTSAWTPPLRVTALPLGYWDVTGGIRNDHCSGLDVFFSFGRANRFRPDGSLLTVRGPDGWNNQEVFQHEWDTSYVGFVGRGAVSGEYQLTYERSDKVFTATVNLDASLILPVPEIQGEILPGRRFHATWSCEGAEHYGICWGPRGMAGCFGAGTATDTTLVALENDQYYWFDLHASRGLVHGQKASAARLLLINWEAGVVTEVAPESNPGRYETSPPMVDAGIDGQSDHLRTLGQSTGTQPR